LSAAGWTLTAAADDGTRIAVLPQERSRPWDLGGGRHCPSYVRGWDPHTGAWVERIYYAGAADNLWGPYAIGYLQWDGSTWIDQPQPAFVATEPWERGSVYEPNLIYFGGAWRLWYVAGANQDDYLVHGYAESADGVTGWSAHRIFAPPEMKLFDFKVFPVVNGYEAVFSRVTVRGTPGEDTGLWWSRCETPSPNLEHWTTPAQIMTAQDRGWHAGPWKPSPAYAEDGRLLVFFSGAYSRQDGSPFPFAFTTGCAQIDLGALR
jgi:hypothetical protein